MRDPQKRWMVFVRENPNLEMDGDWGYPYDLGHHHIWCLFQASKSDVSLAEIQEWPGVLATLVQGL